MNDFERCLEGAVLNMYADDTSITCSSTDIASLKRYIEIQMANVAEWMRQNRLSLNANKSEFMVIDIQDNTITLMNLMKLKSTRKNR